MSTRNYRVIGATEDEQLFCSRGGICLSNPRALPPRIVHVADRAAYRADRYVAYDLSVSAYMRKAEISGSARDWVTQALRDQDARDAGYPEFRGW